MALSRCYKCVTVSLVPVTALALAVVFASGIVILPVLYEELAHHVKVRASLAAHIWHVCVCVRVCNAYNIQAHTV